MAFKSYIQSWLIIQNNNFWVGTFVFSEVFASVESLYHCVLINVGFLQGKKFWRKSNNRRQTICRHFVLTKWLVCFRRIMWIFQVVQRKLGYCNLQHGKNAYFHKAGKRLRIHSSNSLGKKLYSCGSVGNVPERVFHFW